MSLHVEALRNEGGSVIDFATARRLFERVSGSSIRWAASQPSRTLLLLLAIFAVNFMDRQILAVLSEPIKRELALSDTEIGLLYGFGFAVGAFEVEHGAIAFLNARSSFFQRTATSSQWASLSLSPDDLISASIALTGRPIEPPDNFHILRPDPTAMVRLTALHAHARQLAKDAPDRLVQPTVARSIEDALTQAFVACLAGVETAEQPLPRRQHVSVMERFNDFIETNSDQPVYLTQVCKSIAVSERTLRRCCLEQLGMGPNRYLLLRRLHLARRKLVEARAENSTVTDIATEFGFWAFGRFAGMYRTVFGEPPSATLSRPPEYAKTMQGPLRLAGFV